MGKKKQHEGEAAAPGPLTHNPFARIAQIAPASSAKAEQPKHTLQPVAATSPAESKRAPAPDAKSVGPEPHGALASDAKSAGAEPQDALAGATRSAGAAPNLSGTKPNSATRQPLASEPSAKKSAGRLVLRRETKHRGGKAVVIVTGFGALAHYDEAKTRELAQRLKQQLGCGGTVEQREGGREIVLQGDRPAKVAELLRALGFRVDGVTS